MGSCCGGIYTDCRKAIFDPPTSALEREVLFARIRTYSVRIQYISWNIAATVLLYLFPDSLLNQYIIHDKLYYNIIFYYLIHGSWLCPITQKQSHSVTA